MAGGRLVLAFAGADIACQSVCAAFWQTHKNALSRKGAGRRFFDPGRGRAGIFYPAVCSAGVFTSVLFLLLFCFHQCAVVIGFAIRWWRQLNGAVALIGACIAAIGAHGRIGHAAGGFACVIWRVWHRRFTAFGGRRVIGFALRCRIVGQWHHAILGGIGFIPGHGNGRCSTGNQQKASNGKRDFTAFIVCHSSWSLFGLRTGRGWFCAPSNGKINAHCAQKTDQMCEFGDKIRPNWPVCVADGAAAPLGALCDQAARAVWAFVPAAGRLITQCSKRSILTARQPLRRVAETAGFAYVRRTPLSDGETAR